jgi:hypothetical protein
MTWIVAYPSIAGYASAMADIQVTVSAADGTRRYVDGLQKIYPVGKWILAGFCGNVRIGFCLIDDLRTCLRTAANEPNWAWYPEVIATSWRRRARRIFARLNSEYVGGSQIVLAGVHPTRNVAHFGPNEYPDPFACIMRAPEYYPEPITVGKLASIGSGNDVDKYRERITRLNHTHPVDLVWGDIFASPGESVRMVAHDLGLDVAKTPAPGISQHFLMGIVRRGEITIEPNDWQVIHHDGRREIVRRAPACVTDWPSLQALLDGVGIGSSQAAIA